VGKSHLKLVTPTTKKRTVTPRRRRNGDLRTREYLTEAEVERLMKAATGNRHGHRDATMILVAYRHGLRASELVDLRWDQVDFRTATLHVRRVKQGTPSTHLLWAMSYERYGGYSASRNPGRRLCSHQNGTRRSPLPALLG
jgi:integrase